MFEGNLCPEHETEWETLAVLLPEILNAGLRTELTSVGAVPD